MSTLFHHPVLAALSVALFHSSWVFTIAALLGELMARLATNAQQRYRIYLLALFGGTLACGTILSYEVYTKTEAWNNALLLSASLGTKTALSLTNGLELLDVRTVTNWSNYFSTTYLIGLVIAFGRYAYQYVKTRRLRTGGLLPPPTERERFAHLRKQLVPASRVTWRISQRVNAVLVVGVLRPVILFPVGLLNSLTPAEVEAILRHELMHLLRRDPLWNVLQELVKTIFFYHPAVYWLSLRINREREYACDDAVSADYNKKIYARALLRAAKYSLHPSPPLTMAATNPTHFTQRIQRLFATPSPTRSSGWRSSLVICLALLPILGLFALSPVQLPNAAAKDVEEVIIRGTVIDAATEQPLIGTSIIIVGTNKGTITDRDGNFELQVPEDNIALSIAYVGYQTLEIQLNAKAASSLDVRLSKGPSGFITVNDTPVNVKSTASKRANSGAASLPNAVGFEKEGGAAKNILFIVDGERLESESLKDLDPAQIEAIKVVREKDDLRKLGHGIDFDGAIIVTTKKKE
ncbi:MAG: M56 family metallopeptidase [Bacteroidota bacterium]